MRSDSHLGDSASCCQVLSLGFHLRLAESEQVDHAMDDHTPAPAAFVDEWENLLVKHGFQFTWNAGQADERVAVEVHPDAGSGSRRVMDRLCSLGNEGLHAVAIWHLTITAGEEAFEVRQASRVLDERDTGQSGSGLRV